MKHAVARVLMVALLCVTYQSSNARSVIQLSAFTNTIRSFPAQSSGFYYSDSYGNSIGSRETIHVPVIINQYTNTDAVWVWTNSGQIPANAIVSQYINGNPLFFCRVQYYNNVFYGQLVPNRGCYVNQLSQPFTTYQILVR